MNTDDSEYVKRTEMERMEADWRRLEAKEKAPLIAANAKLAAWRPVVEAACRAVDAGSLYAASDGVHGSDRDNAAGTLKAAVRALAPEHRPWAGGGA